MKKWLKWSLIGLVVLSFISAIVQSNNDAACQEVTGYDLKTIKTAVAFYYQAGSATPVSPMETPVPPTNTLEPTATVTPTRTPRPTVDPTVQAEDDYRRKLGTKASELGDLMEDFGALNSELGENLVSLTDDTFIFRLAFILTEMTKTASELSDIKAPEKFAPVDYWVKMIGPEMEKMEADYIKGIDGLNANYLEMALAHQDNVNRYIDNATAELSKIHGADARSQ